MITPPFRKFCGLLACISTVAAFASLFATAAQAFTIVNWDGGVGGQDYVAGAAASMSFSPGATDISFAGGAATDRQSLRGFNTTTVFSPVSGYPNGVSSSTYSTTYYGAFESIVIDSSGGTSLNLARVNDGGASGSSIQGINRRPAGSTYVSTYIIGFKKSDFLNGGSSGSLTLSSMSISLDTPVTTSSASNMRGRWIIGNGSSYYLFQTTFDMDPGTYSLSDFSSSLWASYTPSASLGTTLNFQPSTFGTVNFDDVQFVGFYAETWDGDLILAGSGSGNGDNISGFSVTDFSVTVVPEPTSAAYVAGAILLLAKRPRRKKA